MSLRNIGTRFLDYVFGDIAIFKHEVFVEEKWQIKSVDIVLYRFGQRSYLYGFGLFDLRRILKFKVCDKIILRSSNFYDFHKYKLTKRQAQNLKYEINSILSEDWFADE